MAYVHFLNFDERFCGSTEQCRQVHPDASRVTCPSCRVKACVDHAVHARMLGHVADYCPDCEQPFNPDHDDPSMAAIAGGLHAIGCQCGHCSTQRIADEWDPRTGRK